MKNTIIKKVVFATSATALITGVGAGAVAGPNAFNLVSSVSAAEQTAMNISAQLISPPDGSTLVNGAGNPANNEYGSTTAIVAAWSWDVPDGTVGGDTTTFTTKYIVANTTQDITDATGQKIGTMNCTNANNTDSSTCVVTYTDAVNGLKNVKANAKISFGAKLPNNNTFYDITINNIKIGSLKSNIILPNKFSDWARISQAISTPQYDLNIDGGPRQFVDSDLNKKQTTTFTLPEDTQPYAQLDCDAIKGNQGGLGYAYGSSPNGTDQTLPLKQYYNVNGVTDLAKNPLQMKIESCSPTEIVVSYIPTTADTGISLYLTSGSNITGNAAKLTDKAIAEKYTGPYNLVVNNSNGSTKTYSTSYDFNTGVGSGQVPPSANPDVKETNYNTPVSVDVTSNDKEGGAPIDKTKTKLVDENGNSVDTLTNADGKYTIKDGVVTFTPATGKVGKAAPVDYRIFDNNGNIAQSNLTVTVNDASNPTASPDTNKTEFNTPVNTNVLENDKVTQANSSWKVVGLKQADGSFDKTLTTDQGVFTVNDDNTVTFTPKSGFSGEVPAVTYQATDSNGKTAESTLTITVGDAVAPTAANDDATTEYNKPVTVNVLENDELKQKESTWSKVELKDADGNLISTLETEEGTFTVNEDNTVTFTPAEDFSGKVPAVSYQATDSNGKAAIAEINVTVGENPNPASVDGKDDKATTKENTPVTIDVFGNDTATNDTIKKDSLTLFDADGNPTTESVTVKGGTYSIVDGKVVFTPEKGFSGEAGKVTYGAITEAGLDYKATVSVTVEKDATPPTKEDTSTPPVKEEPKEDTPKNDNPPVKEAPVEGPKVVTDLVGGTSNMDAAGLAGLGAITILGGAAALRRKRK